MLNEEQGTMPKIFQDLSKETGNGEHFVSLTDVGTLLILALEDMIESLQGTLESSKKNSVASTYKLANGISLNEIKNKVIKVKDLFRIFQARLRLDTYINTLESMDVDINCFQQQVEHYMDDILMDWLLISDTDNAIDYTHNICYRIRELLRKLE